ncbi:AAA family ATPase [Companilactobacillus mishanensis]|uniref:Nuclease SbcCD subunit C n=1 Tax=Companilactobacillus mishanensis TaxID=2486008 RepID=A0ABW9P5Y0_9LACO|nr:SMC family ATPase [Companilactobacillus mishanensis]MQS44577.1 SMC family ATPase [Companilactobacillus mishanensis]
MKPVYLEMNYFGPHEHSIIDFRKLEEAPIFLIGGDTGAGKSTIFDAMTFALFGTTTGDRDAKEMRSQFAPDNQETRVIFYFEQGNNLYKIERKPEQWLAKKSGKGLTKKNSDAKLGIVEEVGGVEIESIASKSMDVGTEISGILNLSADQFKKIILLPQNDFSEFLKSNTADKEKILKKIFGTQVFSDFTSKLKDTYDSSRKQSEKFANDLAVQYDTINLSDEEKEALSHESDEQKVVVLKTFVDARNEKLQVAKTESTTADKALEKADNAFQAGRELQKKFSDLADSKKKYQENIVAKEADVKAKQAHYAELDWANSFKDTVRDLEISNRDLAKNIADKESMNGQVDDAKKANDIAIATSKKLSDQSTDFDEKDKRVKSLTTLIPKVQRYEELNANIEKLTPEISQLEADIKTKSDKSAEISKSIEDKKSKTVNADELQASKDSLLAEREQLNKSLSPLENSISNVTDQVTELKKKSDALEKQLETSKTELESAESDYNDKIKTRQSLMIAQLQLELEDGKPCVVCGSTEHPNVVHNADADESKLKASMQAVDDSQKTYAAAENNLKVVQKNVADNASEIKTKTAELKKSQDDLASNYTNLIADSKLDFPDKFDDVKIARLFVEAIAEVDDKLEASRKINSEIKELEQSLQVQNNLVSEIKLTLSGKTANLKTYQTELEKLSTELKDIEDKNSTELLSEKSDLEHAIAEFQTKFEEAKKVAQEADKVLSNIQTRLKDLNTQIENKTASIKKLKESLKQALSDENAKTDSEDILKSWIDEINDGSISELQATITGYQKEKEILEQDIQKNSAELEGKKVPDIEKLQIALSEAKEKSNALLKQVTELNIIFNNTQNSYENIQHIMKEQGSFAKKLSEITSLYNVVNGREGNEDKLKLETYVVQNYLRKVLNYANDHFINLLSNNRYTFEIASEGANKRTDHGLDINVYDNETGAIRSSNTLSGGETFIAALSIALSLSEVVQSSANGVQIDALFVDEGFGSLDHETLEKAMVALETIGENRMVGVISHIDSMKATIGQQVLIEKVGDGRSRVRLISK